MLLTVDGLDVPAEELAAEDGRLMLLLHVVYNDGTSGVTFLTEHQARISLLDIRTYDPDGHQKSLVAEGFWRLEFELKPPEKEARAIVLHDVMLPAIYLNLQEVIDNIDTEIQQKPCEILAKELRLTSTEMHVYWGGDGLTLPTGEFRLILDSGAEVSGTGFSFDQKFSFKAGPKDEVRDHFIVSWDLPVDLSRAAALWVDGETIPLK